MQNEMRCHSERYLKLCRYEQLRCNKLRRTWSQQSSTKLYGSFSQNPSLTQGNSLTGFRFKKARVPPHQPTTTNFRPLLDQLKSWKELIWLFVNGRFSVGSYASHNWGSYQCNLIYLAGCCTNEQGQSTGKPQLTFLGIVFNSIIWKRILQKEKNVKLRL